MGKTILVLVMACVLVSCGGRAPHNLTAKEPFDEAADCQHLYEEIILAKSKSANYAKERSRASVWSDGAISLAISILGLPFVPFALDFRTARSARTDKAVMDERQAHLTALFTAKQCKRVDNKQADKVDNLEEKLEIERDERRHGELIDAIKEN